MHAGNARITRFIVHKSEVAISLDRRSWRLTWNFCCPLLCRDW